MIKLYQDVCKSIAYILSIINKDLYLSFNKVALKNNIFNVIGKYTFFIERLEEMYNTAIQNKKRLGCLKSESIINNISSSSQQGKF